MIGLLIAPIIILMFAALLLVSVFGSAFNTVVRGGTTTYDENTFQDYANQQYAAQFGAEADYEDHILLVFLVEDEEYYDYNFIAWVGDDVDYRINEMFGSNNSKLGNAIAASAINSESYKYSLDSGIAAVVRTMQGHIQSLGIESSLTCDSGKSQYKSHLTNKTSLELTEKTVNDALTEFTEVTGLSIVIVVDDIDEVLPKSIDVFSLLIAAVLIIVAVVLIVKAVKNRKKKDEDDGSYKGSTQKEKINFDNDF